MELKDLSANWKRLQKTLSVVEQSKSSRKRKADSQCSASQQNYHEKKRRLTRGGPVKDTDTNEKREPNGVPKHSSASLMQWAEENDIPAADVALAYGVGTGEVAGLVSVPDKVNEGMSSTWVFSVFGFELMRQSYVCGLAMLTFSRVHVGRFIAVDCEMVGVGGEEDERSVLARVSAVNFHGEQVYDSFVKPKEYVTNWRTWISGIAPKHMAAGTRSCFVHGRNSRQLDG